MPSSIARPPSQGLSLIHDAIAWLERLPALWGTAPLMLWELGLRVAIAMVFWRSGLTKLPFGNPTTILLFREEYRVPILPPELAATMATTIELAVPWLLILGLGARIGAALLLAQTLVIQIFVYPSHWHEHLLWAVPLLYLLVRGPGRLSLDHPIRSYLLGQR